MGKIIPCVLMMTLMMTACGPGGLGQSPEDLMVAIQEQYKTADGMKATVDLTADYGEKVFDFTVEASFQREGETTITVTHPELLAGITARIAQGETVLEYDGAGLSLGLLDDDGLSPVSAISTLMETVSSGYMARCAWTGEGEQWLEALCRDPDVPEGEGTEFLLTFDRDSRGLVRAEVSVGGTTVLTAQFSDFTFTEMTEDDTGDHADVG